MTSAAPPCAARRAASPAAMSSAASGCSSTAPSGPVSGSRRSGSPARPKASVPSSAKPTRRSHQPRSVRTYCRTGKASKNSLARTMAGPAGTSETCACQATGAPVEDRVVSCRAFSTGLVSTRRMSAASRKRGTTRAARKTSAISVPRPGPSSTRRTGSGAPMRRQISPAQSPISSPNIWLISGAVVKSPSVPNGSRVM